jgi:alkanesulfonate monooxygenase SsuD/methylene tetrahydromethanopterin reductase-like flavin-dependent oxidoreductase (luciferase family)
MRFALSVPCFGTFGDPAIHARLARTAEEAGWDAYFIWDHIRIGEWAGPVTDPWIALAAVATATERITIGPMVTPLPRRRPTKLARETVALDHLSGGRVILGVGIGWPRDIDFGDLGDALDDRTRADQLDEGLAVLTALWSGEPVDHEGEHYTVKGARFIPTPLQQPRIPIWVGGMWPNRRPFRRAARWDGVVPIAVDEQDMPRDLSHDEIREIIAYVAEHREGNEPFEVMVGDSTFGRREQGPELVAAHAAAGVTWWLEHIGWPVDTLEAWEAHIAEGPP